MEKDGKGKKEETLSKTNRQLKVQLNQGCA
jgi:hypothetical protein